MNHPKYYSALVKRSNIFRCSYKHFFRITLIASIFIEKSIFNCLAGSVRITTLQEIRTFCVYRHPKTRCKKSVLFPENRPEIRHIGQKWAKNHILDQKIGLSFLKFLSFRIVLYLKSGLFCYFQDERTQMISLIHRPKQKIRTFGQISRQNMTYAKNPDFLCAWGVWLKIRKVVMRALPVCMWFLLRERLVWSTHRVVLLCFVLRLLSETPEHHKKDEFRPPTDRREQVSLYSR